MTTAPSHRAAGTRPGVLVVLLVVVGVLTAGCVPTGQRPELLDETIDREPAAAPSDPCPAPGPPFELFWATTITVVTTGGPVERCVLVADSPPLRAQGLMWVEDLAGYDGMLFAFPRSSFDAFWMANTLIPLSLAYIGEHGQVVSTSDMEPCPDAVDCLTYGTDTPYRWALEVPQGELEAFGLVEGATLDVDSLPVAAG